MDNDLPLGTIYTGGISQSMDIRIEKYSSSRPGTYCKDLVLRGFLYCPLCAKQLTGSTSKGRHAYYTYYHCKSPCKVRYNANGINIEVEKDLRQLMPKPGMAELFKEIICDVTIAICKQKY
ncbi:hypothetical protein SAMN05192573_107163 [Mucilaginibacter gossypii]|uniref:Recombinase zinc beta ribbon domain-containing protein n=1 Tax=Mucilaginibacter gossypii TaxID=551996 RepID=A0A1G8ADG2_9SPHI|nr:hypothetical protein SAMN05192573_107163 [Mucilaginibacter gossypii]